MKLQSYYTEFLFKLNVSDVSDQELQALLSQKDIATSFAENLLKQFGTDGLDIKGEIPEVGEIGSSSPTNVAADSTTNQNTASPSIKCEATSTMSIIPKCDVKTEPVLKIEKLFGSNETAKFSTTMDSKLIMETVKYVRTIISGRRRFYYVHTFADLLE